LLVPARYFVLQYFFRCGREVDTGRRVREKKEVASLEDLPTLEPLAHATPQGFLGKTFSSLRHANYRYLWFGTVFMSAGQWIQQVTWVGCSMI
jgi:hypothetical protein